MAGADLPLTAIASLEMSWTPGQWLYRVTCPDGVEIRATPSPHALPCGSREQGEYLRVIQQKGRWLKLSEQESEENRNPLKIGVRIKMLFGQYKGVKVGLPLYYTLPKKTFETRDNSKLHHSLKILFT